MKKVIINKQIFLFLSVVAITILLIHSFGQKNLYAQNHNRHGDLMGQWRSQIQFSTGDFATIKDLEFMYVFNYGGTMTESSNYDSAPPVTPAYGIWQKIAPKKFALKYEYYGTKAPDNTKDIIMGWLPSTRGVFSEIITLSENGNYFDSIIEYKTFDLKGNPIEGGGKAIGKGIKLTF
ncbi:hypothetical protein [Geminocystis sp. NIES-3709]|uniref:hypothetical protein n=1 Tax=Geminocystis sp. NIES-3709 TaxID=1617448 RepID=UPI0005FC6A9B|nr:hypothetical protein [Geminocystis sp. NIES-3709]BAQ64183.1 hypothetical protein GM3709_948 [Geminocystis sp. NIES-3709]